MSFQRKFEGLLLKEPDKAYTWWQRSPQQPYTWLRRISQQQDFLHKRTKTLLCLKKQYKSRLVAAISNQQPGKEHPVLSLRAGDEVQMFCEIGQLDRAMKVLVRMDQQGTVPSVDMYRSLLKVCTKKKALVQAKRVYAHLAKNRLDSTTSLVELVVCTLAQCGGFDGALKLFHSLPHRTALSWSAVICGYITSGQGQKALKMFECMQQEGMHPTRYNFVSLIKACSSAADLQMGKRIHAETLKYRCASDLFVATCLVDMYGKCGSIDDAQKVFDGLSQRDVVLWNAMISAYVQQGQSEKALQLYENMMEEGASPDDRTFVSVLRACGMLAEKEENAVVDGLSTKPKSLEKGQAIHAAARQKGYDLDVFVGSTLISMYGKCGSIEDAQDTFDELSNRDVVTWNALLTAYVQQGQGERALHLFEQMQEKGIRENHRTFVSAIQACGLISKEEEESLVDGRSIKPNSLEKGQAIHADASRKGYDSDVFVGNTLIGMYGKCGSIKKAEQVFDGLLTRNVVTWTAMLVAYIEQNEASKAFLLYRQMQHEGVTPDVRTFVCALQACMVFSEKEMNVMVDGQSAKVESLEMGMAVHADAWNMGYGADVFVGSTLVSMYGKCGSLVGAQTVFEGLSEKNVVSWTAMITVYVERGHAEKAAGLYEAMLGEGVSPNARTFVSMLQAYASLAEKEEGTVVDGDTTKARFLNHGKVIHADAWSKGYDSNVFVGNTLLSMYGKCESIKDTVCVFDGLCQPDIVSWNAMVATHVEQGLGEDALHLYRKMLLEGVSPDVRTVVSALHACGLCAEEEVGVLINGSFIKVESLEIGKAIHAEAKRKSCDSDLFAGSTLISVYGKCGSIVDAYNVFESLSKLNVVVWTSMLGAYVEQGQAEKALQLYGEMQSEGLSPDVHTVVSALQACGMLAEKEVDVMVDGRPTKVKSLEMGLAIHADARRKGYESNVFVGKTLVSMFGKCGSTSYARDAFDGLSVFDIVSWNTMIGAYVEQGQGDEALQLYRQMEEKGVASDDITVVCILQAWSMTGSLDALREFHHSLISPMKDVSSFVASTLISAYGRCASMVDAQRVFDSLPHPDGVSWNALITAYARQGNCTASLQCYQEMRLAGVQPDGVTFVSLLAACSHAGLVDKGVDYFESMTRDYGLCPEIEHYASMVDLLGRAGYFTMVEQLFSTMPIQPNLAMWLCLLGACRMHGKVVLGKRAFDQAVSLQPSHSAAYVMMWNIYADAGLWDCANEVNAWRQGAGAWKKPGESWIEHDHEVMTFLVGNRNHQRQDQLHDLIRRVGSELKGDGHITYGHPSVKQYEVSPITV